MTTRSIEVVFTTIALILAAGFIYKFGLDLSIFSNDTTSYIQMAESLLGGRGFVECAGRIVDEYPPFHAVILAIPVLFGLAPIDSLMVVGVISFAGIVFCTLYFARSCHFRGSQVLCGAVIVGTPAVLYQASVASSDATFALLACLFLIWLESYLDHRTWRRLIAGALLVAACALHRYIGTILILLGALAIVAAGSRSEMRRHLPAAIVFSTIGILPLTAWLVRNLVSTGHPTGPRILPAEPFLKNLADVTAQIGHWTYWDRIINRIGLILKFDATPLFGYDLLLGSLVLGTVAVLYGLYCRFPPVGAAPPTTRRIHLLVAFVVLYTGYLAALRAITGFELLGARFVVPIVPMLFALLTLLVDDQLYRLRGASGRWLRCGVAVAVAAWLSFPIGHIAAQFAGDPNYRPAGISITAAQARHSTLVAALQALPPGTVRADDFGSVTFGLLYLGYCPADRNAGGYLFQLHTRDGLHFGPPAVPLLPPPASAATRFDHEFGSIYRLNAGS